MFLKRMHATCMLSLHRVLLVLMSSKSMNQPNCTEYSEILIYAVCWVTLNRNNIIMTIIRQKRCTECVLLTEVSIGPCLALFRQSQNHVKFYYWTLWLSPSLKESAACNSNPNCSLNSEMWEMSIGSKFLRWPGKSVKVAQLRPLELLPGFNRKKRHKIFNILGSM